MRRREFIALLVGATAACPFMSRAQGRTARVGVLMVIVETDPESERLAGAFEKGLDEAGWHKGRNLELTYRWSASNPDLLSRYAEELVRAAPDILLAFGTAALIPLHKATTTIPIVFSSVSNPVGQGFVASVSHPGGNVTGFSNFDPDIGSRWLQVLKDAAPAVTHVTRMFNPRTAWPRIARAQQGERVRLVGILRPISEDGPVAKPEQMAFLEGLRQLGWTPGRNVRIEVRWSGGDEAKTRKDAAELIALAPDVIVASGSLGAEVMLKATKTIPIVFVLTPDPVGSG